MRKLKKYEFDFSSHGLKFGIKQCCVIFYESVWLTCIRADIPEYFDANIHDSKNGIILCPECVIKNLK